MKIGVISDTHIPKRAKTLPDTVLKTFEDVEHIIHAGDIMSMDVIYKLEEIAPVTAVAGNTDPDEILEKFGNKKIITFGKFNFGVFHGHGTKGTTIGRVAKCFENDRMDCIIFGHSHIPYCQFHDGVLLFNPGSPTDKRRNIYYSFGIIVINEDISASIIYFNSEGTIKEINQDI
ncbi:MAG TPA: metallophosphoesterase family protein [Clostridiaceae bacterium]|nr:metallophosphoesterase family protein [Clostridiaceae bacterium]